MLLIPCICKVGAAVEFGLRFWNSQRWSRPKKTLALKYWFWDTDTFFSSVLRMLIILQKYFGLIWEFVLQNIFKQVGYGWKSDWELSLSSTLKCVVPIQCCGSWSGSKLDPYSGTLCIQIRIPNTDQDPHRQKTG